MPAWCVSWFICLPPSFYEKDASDALAERVVQKVSGYFAQPDFCLDLALARLGTLLQRNVWQAIAAMALGQVLTYGQVAKLVESSPRAVGQACGSNWFPFCRRYPQFFLSRQRRRFSYPRQTLVVGARGRGLLVRKPRTDGPPKRALTADTQSAIDEFCDSLWLEDGLAKNSLGAYRRDMTLFALWLQEQPERKSLLAIDADDLNAYFFRPARYQQGHVVESAAGGIEAFLSAGVAAKSYRHRSLSASALGQAGTAFSKGVIGGPGGGIAGRARCSGP